MSLWRSRTGLMVNLLLSMVTVSSWWMADGKLQTARATSALSVLSKLTVNFGSCICTYLIHSVHDMYIVQCNAITSIRISTKLWQYRCIGFRANAGYSMDQSSRHASHGTSCIHLSHLCYAFHQMSAGTNNIWCTVLIHVIKCRIRLPKGRQRQEFYCM